MGRCSGIALAAVLTAVIPTEATAAECGTHAVDACLIGAWKQTGGGAAEWMRQNLKMALVKVSASETVITLSRDGTFSTSRVEANAEVTAKDAGMQASAQMTSQGSGQWTAADGKLTLCLNAVASKGTAQIKLPNGMTVNMPAPQAKASVSTMSYSCSGDALSTVQPMAQNTTMTTTYSRVK